ncbi:MAG: Minf_1886 family protein [Phycisphaerales bacterium]
MKQSLASEFELKFRAARERAGPYPVAAYEFVKHGLDHTCKTVAGESERRHISGEELCLGLRDFALRQYGRLARTVLAKWHIHSTDDFGKIVFAMIEAKILAKTEEDSAEDFRAVFDFEEAFGDLAGATR